MLINIIPWIYFRTIPILNNLERKMEEKEKGPKALELGDCTERN